jgi:outer membrane protein, heavy metal efflux system
MSLRPPNHSSWSTADVGLAGLVRVCLAMASAFEALTLTSRLFAQGHPPVSEQQLEVPSLARVLQLAVEKAPDVVIGRSALRSSESSYVGARLWPVQNPYVELYASNNNRVGSQGSLFQGTLWLPLEVTGQRGARLGEAKSFVATHQFELERARSQARAIGFRAWGRAVVEAERIRTLGELEQSAKAESKAFRARRDAGDATERDAQLAEVERARHEMLVEESRGSLQAAMGELERITGQIWATPRDATIRVNARLERTSPREVAAHSPFVRVSRAQADYYAQVDEKWSREAVGPVSLMLSGGHGTAGETILGAGLAWTLPTFRRFQGERAKAQAEREHSLIQAGTFQREIEIRLTSILRELEAVRRAMSVLDNQALPAAHAARAAAEHMFQMGKIDILSVLVSRRDEALLRLRKLDLAEQEWGLVADWVELSGAVPQ